MQLRTSPSSLESNINVTPLVDVCLVLLIIFMVVMPAIVNGVEIKLPKTATGGHLAAEQLKITVKADGTVYLNGLIVRADQVPAEVQRLHAANASQGVVVRGDKDVKYGEVVKVLDACRAAGYADVGLASDPLPRAAPQRQ